jgi:hypothetical protein
VYGLNSFAVCVSHRDSLAKRTTQFLHRFHARHNLNSAKVKVIALGSIAQQVVEKAAKNFTVPFTVEPAMKPDASKRTSHERSKSLCAACGVQAPMPTDRKVLNSWVSLAAYYARFVPGFAALARPLFEAVHNRSPYCLSDEIRTAVVAIKAKLTKSLVFLTTPDYITHTFPQPSIAYLVTIRVRNHTYSAICIFVGYPIFG